MAKDNMKQQQTTGAAEPATAQLLDARLPRTAPGTVVVPGAAKATGAAGAGVPGAAGPMPAAHGAPGQPGGSRKRTVIVVLVCVLLAVAVWLAIWLFACNGSSLFDANAQDGQAPYKSAEEMQAELDRVVEEGMFNISIAGAIQFDDGTSDGIAYIENVPGNRYLMQVRIVADDTGEVLYESGVLKPNQFIEKIALTRDLDAGTYPATATFTALDPTSYDEVGQAAAKVTINVLE